MCKSICLVSGGLDSCVAAAIALQESKTVAFLHVSYGQLTRERELESFIQIANSYGIRERLTVQASHLAAIGGSALTDESIQLPPGDFDRQGIPVSYVPFRNANLLAIATSWGEVISASKIFIGAVEEDSSGYPDCRESFFDAFNRLILLGTKPTTDIKIVTPLIAKSKKQIVEKGIELKAPLHLTWSCYKSSKLACGECDSCLLRLRGFEQAGVPDPIPYLPT